MLNFIKVVFKIFLTVKIVERREQVEPDPFRSIST